MGTKKILSAFVMLLITMVALTTASYAWFSVNSAVQLAGLDVNVAAAEGIQVSTDASTWKASLTTTDIANGYSGHTNQLPTLLAPVSTVGSQAEGTFAMFGGTLVEGTTTTLNASSRTDTAGAAGDYIAFDLFIKATSSTPIYLDAVSDIAYETTGAGSSVGLEFSSRVAFFNQGTDATSTPATARALATGTSASQVIWEPHALEHTAVALGNGASVLVKTAYYGLKATGTGLTTTDFAGDSTHYGAVTTITPDTDTVPFEQIAGNVIFTAGAGITKIRIYIWIEGQDVDCENNASLGFAQDNLSKIVANIKFIKA